MARFDNTGICANRSRQTAISLGESSVSETRIVSPNPSHSKEPMPMALLIRPSSPSPASVTPKWMVVVLAGDAGELQSAFHHAKRRVTEAVHDAIAERAVIGADAHGAAQFL